MEADSNKKQILSEADKNIRMDVETADRVFRTQTEFGIAVSEEFKKKKYVLSQVYETVRTLCYEGLEAERFRPPTAAAVYKAFVEYRGAVKTGTPTPTFDEFPPLLFLLAAQEIPFIEPVKELFLDGEGRLKFQTGFVASLKRRPGLPHEACRDAVVSSREALRKCIGRDFLYPDWDKVHAGFASPAPEGTQELRKGRGDYILRGLFFPIRPGDQLDSENRRKVNDLLRRDIFLPLLKTLRESGLIVSMSCGDIRRSDPERFGAVSDLVWLNVPERITERYKNLSRLLLSDYFNAFLNEEHYELLHGMDHNDENFLENCGVLAGNLLYAHAADENLSREQRDILIELCKLREWNEIHIEQDKLRSDLDGIAQALEEVASHKGLFDAISNGKYLISRSTLQMVLDGKIKGVLALMVPLPQSSAARQLDEIPSHDSIYLLYRDRKHSEIAVASAIQHYNQTGDDFLPRILEGVLQLETVSDEHLKEYIAPVHLNQLRSVLRRIYTRYMPWYVRLRHNFFGGAPAEERVKKVRGKLAVQERRRAENLERSREKKREQDVKKRLRETGDSFVPAPHSSSGANSFRFSKTVIAQVSRIIEEEWSNNRYPRRTDLIKDSRLRDHIQVSMILGAVEAGEPDVQNIVRIPVAKQEAIYGTRSYLNANRPNIESHYKQWNLKQQAAGADANPGASAHANAQIEHAQYEAIAKYLRQFQ